MQTVFLKGIPCIQCILPKRSPLFLALDILADRLAHQPVRGSLTRISQFLMYPRTFWSILLATGRVAAVVMVRSDWV